MRVTNVYFIMKILLTVIVLLGCLWSVQAQQPLHDITERKLRVQAPVLSPAPIREADIFWEKRVWREVDLREKQNLPLSYPERPFVRILFDRIKELGAEAAIYSPEDDGMRLPMPVEELENLLYRRDTVYVVDPETQQISTQIVHSTLGDDAVLKIRLHELWYFDQKTSSLHCQLLGIAPVQRVYGENGELRMERPLCWIAYRPIRDYLSTQSVFVAENDRERWSWTQWLDSRQFSGRIYKVRNVGGDRLQDQYSGTERLLESEKLDRELQNFEMDLWSY